MKAYERTLAKWVTEKSEDLGERFLDLVRGCNTDLYNGPLTAEDAEAEGRHIAGIRRRRAARGGDNNCDVLESMRQAS